VPNSSDRKAIHAYVSDEAHETLYEFSEAHSASISGLLEAWLLDLREEMADDGPNCRMGWVEHARRIDVSRRRRRGG
jgi:hypothetical protein